MSRYDYPMDDREVWDLGNPEDYQVCDVCGNALRSCVCLADERRGCEICHEPVGDGGALCPACAANDAEGQQRCGYCGRWFGSDMRAEWFPFCSTYCQAQAQVR